jgi:hypothetical protein
MNVIESTKSYEHWLSRQTALVSSDLKYKHRQMNNPKNPFPFFRGTYYRWLQLWTKVCSDLADAPRCHAVGDLHIDNFGTWRDLEGRLNWGVNDFDEADDYPYTLDLVRLAASTALARSIRMMRASLTKSCQAIEAGYRKQLEAGGKPFVLEEKNRHLRRLAYHQEREPTRYWKKMSRLLLDEPYNPSKELKELLKSTVPEGTTEFEYRHRPKVGMGSLGKLRIVVLCRYDGAWLAREAKVIVASAKCWQEGIELTKVHPRAQKVLSSSIRCHDPYFHYGEHWVNRRLGPHCGRIELANIPDIAEEGRMLVAMGKEIANIHLGSHKAIADIKKHLSKMPENWLFDASSRMAEVIVEDWRSYLAHNRRRRRRSPTR